MNSETVVTGFGRYLQAIRLGKGITLEKVSEETRIGLGILKSIEQEVLDELPAEVFLKGFLRAYSKFIGADGDEVIQRYESQRDVSHKITVSENAPKTISNGSFWKFAIALFVLGLVMLFSIFGIKWWNDASHSAKTYKSEPAALIVSAAGISCLNQTREI